MRKKIRNMMIVIAVSALLACGPSEQHPGVAMVLPTSPPQMTTRHDTCSHNSCRFPDMAWDMMCTAVCGEEAYCGCSINDDPPYSCEPSGGVCRQGYGQPMAPVRPGQVVATCGPDR